MDLEEETTAGTRRPGDYRDDTSHGIDDTEDSSRLSASGKVEGKDDAAARFLVKYQGRSYDIREFLRRHPGGKNTLRKLEGLSVDRAMKENPHSKAAYHIFEDFALADLREHVEVENLVDWNVPLLWQVGFLADRYWEWVNLPVNRTIRLFKSDILELLSVTPWFLVPTIWCPICLYFIYMGCTVDVTRIRTVIFLFEALVAFGCGVLIWTIFEYLIHRNLFHLRPPPDSKILITLHFLTHGVHHKAPFDEQRLLFPPIVGIFAIIIILPIYKAIFPSDLVYFVAGGTSAGYLCYDLIHFYLHYGAPKDGTYLYKMKRNHNYHHFSHHDQGFGISSKLWDYVFGTDIRLRTLKKPIEW